MAIEPLQLAFHRDIATLGAFDDGPYHPQRLLHQALNLGPKVGVVHGLAPHAAAPFGVNLMHRRAAHEIARLVAVEVDRAHLIHPRRHRVVVGRQFVDGLQARRRQFRIASETAAGSRGDARNPHQDPI